MDRYDSVQRGQNSFSYENHVLNDGVSITEIRDPQDELFARVEYTPATEDYVIEVDGGYSTTDDLRDIGLLNYLDIQKTERPVFNNMLGTFEHPVINDWEDTVYGITETENGIVEAENITNPEQKTVIRFSSSERDLVELATTLLDRLNPPTHFPEPGDVYEQARQTGTKELKTVKETRNETLEEVFNTALNLTEDMLEQKKGQHK